MRRGLIGVMGGALLVGCAPSQRISMGRELTPEEAIRNRPALEANQRETDRQVAAKGQPAACHSVAECQARANALEAAARQERVRQYREIAKLQAHAQQTLLTEALKAGATAENAWTLCLGRTSGVATHSSEPADTVVKASFAMCAAQEQATVAQWTVFVGPIGAQQLRADFRTKMEVAMYSNILRGRALLKSNPARPDPPAPATAKDEAI